MSARGKRIIVEEKTPQRVAVVDDDPALPVAVREHLQQTGESWQVTAYHNGADALKGVAAAPPQVVLMAQTLPDGCGILWAGRLKARHNELPVVIHTKQGSPEKLFRALSLGALGYVVKNGAELDWAHHLQQAMQGRFTMCGQTARLLPQLFAGLQPAWEHWHLSRREREVMACLCRNLSDKEIATGLGVSDETVHGHLRNTFHKLGVHDRKAAVEKFTQKWLGGGKMAGRDFHETDPFLTLLEYCIGNSGQVQWGC